MNEERRSLPYDVDLEQALLGVILSDNTVIDETAPLLSDQDFYDPLHRVIWAAAVAMRGKGQRVSPLTVVGLIGEHKGFAEVGGVAYLKSIARAAPGMPNTPDYCRILRDLAMKRSLLAEGEALADNCAHVSTEVSAEELISEHQDNITAIVEGRPQADEPKSWYEAGVAAMESDPTRTVPLLPYGISELDDAIGGMGPGDVVILAGRPGMGKSAVALHIAHGVARDKKQLSLEFTGDETVTTGLGVFLSSLEMTKTEIMHRGLSMRAYAKGAKVPYKLIRQKKLTPKDERILADVLIEDSALPLIIDDKGGQTVGQLAARMRRAQSKLRREGKDLGLGIIDHLQLIEGDGRSDNRVAELTRITKALKALAKALGLPLLVLCQLSREVEKREDKRPQVSDLRESGSIEQDADVVILIHRPEYYLANNEPARGTKEMADWDSAMTKARDRLHIQVPKNRHGAPANLTIDCSIAHNWIGAL